MYLVHQLERCTCLFGQFIASIHSFNNRDLFTNASFTSQRGGDNEFSTFLTRFFVYVVNKHLGVVLKTQNVSETKTMEERAVPSECKAVKHNIYIGKH